MSPSPETGYSSRLVCPAPPIPYNCVKPSNIGDAMFALVLFICYLDGGCDDLVIDVFNTEQQCMRAMNEQRLRHGGCFPVEDFIDSFWRPAQEYSDF